MARNLLSGLTVTTPMTRPRLPQLLLALALTALVVALGGVSAYRKIASFQPIGFAAEPGQGFWRVTAAAGALAPDDRILLVNGRSPATSTALREEITARPSSELLVQRGGEIRTVAWARPPLAIDWPYLLLALTGVLYLLVGVYTLLRDGRRAAVVFHLWTAASAAVYILTPTPPLDAAGRLGYAFEELARLALPALTLHLFLVFPAPITRASWLRPLIAFVYLPAAILATFQLDLMVSGGRWIVGPPTAATLVVLDRLELYLLVLFALMSVALLVRRLDLHRDWEQHRQVLWVALGMAGGYVPFVLLYVAPLALHLRRPPLLETLAVAPLALVPLAFAWAILRWKLWDIGPIVRDTLSATLTLFLGVAGFSLVHLLVSRGVPESLGMTRSVLTFVAGLAIAGLLVPARASIGEVLERLQHRGAWRVRRALVGFGRELLQQRELAPLCRSLLQQLESGLALERANLLLVQGDVLVPVRPEAGLPASLPVDPADELWDRPVSALSAVALPTPERPPAQMLAQLGYRYAFPLQVRDGRVGIVLAGHQLGGMPLASEDLDLVRGLLNQAALAIENAQLVHQLQLRLAEVTRLQEHNQEIIESSPAGIVVLDAAERVVSANGGFAALVGRTRERVLGTTVRELLPIAALPEPGQLVETSLVDGAGRDRHLQLTLGPFGGDDLRIVVVQDVTERVAMENELKEKERLAALGMLAAGVAHEVNTPITGISSYAQMLIAETRPDDPHYPILKKVERQTFRAARIVSNLLEFARNRQNPQRPLELAPVLRESLELLRERMQDARVVLDYTDDGSRPVVVGNDGELQQVFTNLVVNAIDAMPRGGHLAVRLACDGDRVRVRFTDDGTGIPAEILEKVFQPFFSTKLAKGGTGLGLSISYNIARRHGGTIHVDSGEGKGCCFTVELPRQSAAAATATA